MRDDLQVSGECSEPFAPETPHKMQFQVVLTRPSVERRASRRYDITMPRGTGHWELQNDLKVIYEKANPGA